VISLNIITSMCLILFAYRSHPRYPLIVAANRDEFFSRPAKVANYWGSTPEILGGRDLQGGGTWLAIEPSGSFGAVTNYRDPSLVVDDAPSRGKLVIDFLTSSLSTDAYLDQISQTGSEHNGYNFLAYRNFRLGYCSNRGRSGPTILGPGVYGLSNHLLDTPWPKVERGKAGLRQLLMEGDLSSGSIADLLVDRHVADDTELPSTGVPLDVERSLSSIFIRMKGYGTRCSTTVLFGSDGSIDFSELTYYPDGRKTRKVSYMIPAQKDSEQGRAV
jgi:uncharacterized protein with NRDE domain